MASYLQIENISKSYGPKVLFENIGFNINEGDKMALIAPNGTGKTSLLRILAGKDKSDSGGKILFLKDIRIAFLEQEYDYEPERGIFDQIMAHSTPFTDHLDTEHLWEYERRVKQYLTSFRLTDPGQKMKELSGGEIKRVALAEMLASEADFFIMDEPTNHLDIEAIEFLENFLSRSRCTLLMVTHDRYFLDKVCNTIMELDHGSLYIYRGDYQNYLEKRSERIANRNAETDKVRNILRRELEWMRSTPQARTGKARYRINAFHELKDRAEMRFSEQKVSMSDLHGTTRLGTKIINCKDVSFYYGDTCYLNHFTYNFQRYEKVGIVGRNGAGKSTFINLLAGNYSPDMVSSDPSAARKEGQGLLTGIIERGESLKTGYYRQGGMEFNPQDTVLDIVNDTRLLGRFLFPHDMLNNRIEKLSGGEKRRLYLLTVLMQQPNLLILDEPTNDLDIVTLNILEEYLREFQGTLIIISHDRHFLDRLVDHLFVFCGDGIVKDFTGSYSEYREFIRDYEAGQKSRARAEEKAARTSGDREQRKDRRAGEGTSAGKEGNSAKKKLSYKEQRELEQLEKELQSLNEEKASLEEQIGGGSLGFEDLRKASERISAVMAMIDEKENRWLELSC
ncbi:MAG: ABC-F family ATP-binding cassette domain-containing protein [Bacteroidetes bacterium]|uniref:ABC-F family ATP-binding cassette domain-containing protein n=1 Tax=Candidatus Cryptobacteroides gallistercoris TaxID=2840765 RepID=A0A940DQK0_9BACT|nr:ABC-F family ATP-binding cassette domain-containing protein [Candidatus Cryptobacteroides gallistercoris]